MRLIDADKVKFKSPYGFDNNGILMIPYHSCKCSLDNAPTVDAVPVIRCRECTHYNGHRHCDYFYQAVLNDDFCSYGEKKRPTNSAPLNQEERWLKTV